MAPTTKVKISHWLLTLVLAVISGYSGYQVVIYKVEENKKEIAKLEVEADVAGEEITDNKTDIALIQNNITNLRTDVVRYTKENKDSHTAIQRTMKEIKDKMP